MHFKFSPSILSRLGEELVPNPDQGILELVKNSYDADATICEVILNNTEASGGSVTISDNGDGMDIQALRDSWLVLGKSKKASRSLTRLKRMPVGDKGLGRLAALRQGTQVKIFTRPKDQPNVEYSLEINWEDFDRVDFVEDVTLEVDRSETIKEHGTEIIINNLKAKFGRKETKRLARELLLLADPFSTAISFRPKLIASGFDDLEKQVNEAFFDDAEYHVKASLNVDGKAQVSLWDWKRELINSVDSIDVYQEDKEENSFDTSSKAVPAEFEMWIFELNPQSFNTKGRKGNLVEIRDWLNAVGGVHMYYRGLRVAPYGDRDDDWLKINYQRTKNPEARPSTSTVIGRVITEDPDNQLVQKTDRLGFMENDAYLDLRNFAIKTLDWVADERLKIIESKRSQSKQEAKRHTIAIKEEVRQVIAAANMPTAVQSMVIKVVEEYEKANDQKENILRADLQLYRSLATAGTTAAVFAHESSKKITLIRQLIEVIDQRIKDIAKDQYEKLFSKQLIKMYQIAGSLENFAKYPIYLLGKDKRKSINVDVNLIITNLIELFKTFFENARIEIEFDSYPEKIYIKGSIALLESIVTNLLTNTVNAFSIQGANLRERKVILKTEISDGFALLTVMDSASGIKGLDLDEIWLPGRSTTPGGTGLGLTIVKDSVEDLGGRITVIPNGQLGGAEFIVQLKLKHI
ncbi:sensor histidine kinase [Pseudanabaena sp. ABRG5-3]|uniref:sensor histidine kinase n=1 Tax=Pseudanabaena sp. ABRG5-3 TaxID=685565 RepID=UPI000DC700AB|nr:sensor histidine kinase [Pseudanabaena sp. ABRG5-3]BBC26951.1 ATPase, histidine kinase-, DNA gyrase B-, and HSP90-like domain protein [Pseudanabaena sp. ABRG5-3]